MTRGAVTGVPPARRGEHNASMPWELDRKLDAIAARIRAKGVGVTQRTPFTLDR